MIDLGKFEALTTALREAEKAETEARAAMGAAFDARETAERQWLDYLTEATGLQLSGIEAPF